MADDKHADPITIMMAILAAGGDNAKIPEYAAMMGEGSYQWDIAKKTLEAAIFTSTFHSLELEESSTRAVVTLVKNQAGETEAIRTERTDGLGASIYARLKQLKRGDRIMIWKAVETMANDPNRKVRVLTHFRKLRSQDAESGSIGPTQPGAQRSPEGSPTPPTPAAEAPPLDTTVVPSDGDVRATIRRHLAEKNPEARGRIVADLRTQGWATASDIPEEKLDMALYMVLHDGELPF